MKLSWIDSYRLVLLQILETILSNYKILIDRRIK